MHEIGHSLGLGESSVGGSVMYGTYTARKTALASDDINGIRSIYSSNGPRTADAYNTNGASNGTLGTAASINPLLGTSTLTGLVPNLDITNAGQSEYFSFKAPAGSGSTLELDMQSSGLSLLSPKVTVYASNGSTVLASANGEGQYGTTLTVSIPNVTAGEKFYVLAQGADTTQMGTGRYALGLNFKGATPPTEASPIVAVPNGNPQHTGDGQADGAHDYPACTAVPTPVITGISPDNGVSSQDGVTNNARISILGTAPANDTITVYENGQAIGQTVVLSNNTWTFNNTANPLSDGDYSLTALATDPAGYSMPLSYAYEVVIDTHTPQPPQLNDISPDTGLSLTDGITDVNDPTFSGTTEPYAVVNLYDNGGAMPFGSTEADASGNWSFTIGQPGQVTYPGANSTILSPVVSLVDDLPIVGGLLGGLLGGLARWTSSAPARAAELRPVRRGFRPVAARRHLQRDRDRHGHRRHGELVLSGQVVRHRHPAAAFTQGHGHQPQYRSEQRRHHHGAKPDDQRDGPGGQPGRRPDRRRPGGRGHGREQRRLDVR